jgi:hypothetical protein
VWIGYKAFGFLLPARADELIRSETGKGFAPLGEVVSVEEGIAGDQTAFKAIVKWCQSNPNSARTVTFDYLKTVKGANSSDPLTGILANLDNVVYDPGTAAWSIPVGGNLQPAPSAAASTN